MTNESSVRIQRLPGWLLTVCALVLLVSAQIAAAAPATQVWTGDTSGAHTPDLQLDGNDGLAVYGPDGTTNVSTVAGTINFTIDGSPAIGYCIDSSKPFSQGSEQVDLTQIVAPTLNERAIAWILTNQTPAGTPTDAKRFDGATSQIAVWLLSNQVRPNNPTSIASLNAAAAALRDQALAAVQTPATLQASATAPAAGATSSVVTVQGRPGATVTLAIASGTGTLSATSVVLDGSGRGQATLTTSGPGAVNVSASTAGDPTLVRVAPVSGMQATVYAKPSTLNASVVVTFTAAPVVTTPVTPAAPAPVTTPGTPVAPAPSVTVAQTAAKLAITKVGPSKARAGSLVRYTISVRNTGTGEAKNVMVTDIVPAGLTLVSPRGTVRGNTVTWSVGTLAPGASKTITVRMHAKAGLRGVRTNVATATAIGVAKVTARARTQFTAVRQQQARPVVRPAVTG